MTGQIPRQLHGDYFKYGCLEPHLHTRKVLCDTASFLGKQFYRKIYCSSPWGTACPPSCLANSIKFCVSQKELFLATSIANTGTLEVHGLFAWPLSDGQGEIGLPSYSAGLVHVSANRDGTDNPPTPLIVEGIYCCCFFWSCVL